MKLSTFSTYSRFDCSKRVNCILIVPLKKKTSEINGKDFIYVKNHDFYIKHIVMIQVIINKLIN